MIKYIFIFPILLILFNCSKETIYSGKILNQEVLDNINFYNKENLVNKLGEPTFKDPVENKFFYFSEKKVKESIFKTNTFYSYLFVFEFDKEGNILNSKVYDLKDKKSINLVKDETESEIVKRGLIERIFGGVGAQQELPTPQ